MDEVLDHETVPEDIVCIRELNAGAEGLIETSIDSERMRRAIVNVITNAIDAIQEAGRDEGEKRLTVSTQVITGQSGSRLEIRISDTGIGIPDDAIDRLFEPLFSTKSFGVGLGMPIIKDIMEQHRGGIEIDSQTGVGTTIILWLPVAGGADGAARSDS